MTHSDLKMASVDFGVTRKWRNLKILSNPFVGPLCHWLWRFLLLGIVIFLITNLIFIVVVFIDKPEDDDEMGPNGIVHRKLEDIIFNKVNGQEDLFEEIHKKVARTKFLIVSYSKQSSLVQHLGLEDTIFMVDINQKIKDHNPSLDIYWGKVSRTNTATALSLIRLNQEQYSSWKAK